MKSTEIIHAYTKGEYTLEQANAELKLCGSHLALNPGRNRLTEEEIKNTVVSEDPEKVTGWGLLDVGVGGLEKVHVVNGVTVDYDNGADTNYALVLIGGRMYQLKGGRLVKR